MAIFQESISEFVWDNKYRYRLADRIIDQTIEDTWSRVARAVAKAEPIKQRKLWEKQFLELVTDFKFLPGGRILAGSGTQHKVTLLNCFVMNIAEDSLHGIFNALKEGALTLQQGGGVGYDFSVLRPSGERVETTGSVASGPISFMRIWDSMSATMQSCGARRGAMMGTLRCDHPDIEAFIREKSDPTQLRQFNISVIVTDEFMKAVEENADWALVFPVNVPKESDDVVYRRWSGSRELLPCRVFRYVKARELWKSIIQSAYRCAEPGVIFEDTINRFNPLWYHEWISTTNPCGEIPLPAYGACNLGSINLTEFIINPYSSSARIDWQQLENTTACATRFLDNVISVSNYPLKAQQKEALASRRIGLGFTGLADALIMIGIRYGSAESLAITREIMQKISHVTWQASIDLAREKNIFPCFDKNKYLQGEFVKQLPAAIFSALKRFGVRNSHHNAIAPTGTISLLANNISNGIEPVFSERYKRNVRLLNGDIKTFNVTDYALHLWQQQKNAAPLPPGWIDTQALLPADHLNILAAVQPFVDNAISKTINVPENFPFAKLQEIYSQAYRLGLKGCTIFRPNPITGSVLSTEDVDKCCPV